jgi:hypothetical protein
MTQTHPLENQPHLLVASIIGHLDGRIVMASFNGDWQEVHDLLSAINLCWLAFAGTLTERGKVGFQLQVLESQVRETAIDKLNRMTLHRCDGKPAAAEMDARNEGEY